VILVRNTVSSDLNFDSYQPFPLLRCQVERVVWATAVSLYIAYCRAQLHASLVLFVSVWLTPWKIYWCYLGYEGLSVGIFFLPEIITVRIIVTHVFDCQYFPDSP
jgi:hypothetical protein